MPENHGNQATMTAVIIVTIVIAGFVMAVAASIILSGPHLPDFWRWLR